MQFLSNLWVRTIIPLLLWGTIGHAVLTQAQTTSTATPSYSCGPITSHSAATTNDSLRLKRGEHYNSQSNTPLNETSESTLIKFPKSHTDRDPLPLSSSDTVVIGTITGGQSFLSRDQGNIYSEFQLSIQQVLLATDQHSLLAGSTIDVDREGGSVRLPSGKVLSRCSSAQSMPVIGQRYLLFLKYNQETKNFFINTGYALEGGHIYNLDDFNTQEDKHALDHPLRQQDLTEAQFTERIKSAIAARQEGHQ